jgi:hypothetical protein
VGSEEGGRPEVGNLGDGLVAQEGGDDEDEEGESGSLEEAPLADGGWESAAGVHRVEHCMVLQFLLDLEMHTSNSCNYSKPVCRLVEAP